MVQVTVGGLPLDRFEIASGNQRLTPARLRAAICRRGGLELAHLAMRSALTVPGCTGESLRSRLSRAASRSGSASVAPAIADGAVAGVAWRAVVDPFLVGSGRLTVLGRPRGALPTAGMGRITLIRSAGARMLIAAATAEGRPVARLEGGGGPLLCAPGVAWAAPARHRAAAPASRGPAVVDPAVRPTRSVASFEALFASGHDPWRYESSYEKRKYERTLELLPPRVESLLELACAEGHFTVQAAARADRLVASECHGWRSSGLASDALT